MDRIYSPKSDFDDSKTSKDSLLICKFWGEMEENYDENWKCIKIDRLLDNDFGFVFTKNDLKKFSNQLGQFHRAMMENGICVWEIEIMFGKLKNGELKFFIIDFEKCGVFDKSNSMCYIKNMKPINFEHFFIQDSYPSLEYNKEFFIDFMNGFQGCIYNDGIYNDGIYNDGIYNDGIYNDGIYNDGIYKDIASRFQNIHV